MKRDPLPVLLLVTVALASFVPARGLAAQALGYATTASVMLLLFLHGLRLSRVAVIAGAGHWRLHATTLAITFVAFPLAGLALRGAVPALLPAALWGGLLFLCAVPSTVQSSIAFTAMARGNVPAAVCSATLSNIGGVVLTPLIAAMLLALGPHALGPDKALAIVMQILLPAILGHLARPWGARWAERNRALLRLTDRASILLIVYAAFSAAIVAGLWQSVPPPTLAIVLALDALLLAAVVLGCRVLARHPAFDRPDARAMLFVGSTKSLATGVPIAGVLMPPGLLGVTILPLMLYHPLQSLVCATLAARWGRAPEPA